MARRKKTEEEIREELESASAQQEMPTPHKPIEVGLFPQNGQFPLAEHRPDLYGEGQQVYEIMCVNCYRMIKTLDPREDVCEECYYWLSDQMTEVQQRQAQQRGRTTRPLFNVP